ncbi:MULTISPECIES: LacI family DNA-binding transcriptional regulator [unclassified Bacillus (in: firmicutes)]|uniref:LacI family DNA-binding transcriptional regulator n=1 Tax=unclassified Bacillus (in: firmicutes) TaxID=185979 RepID=UPI0008EB6B3B|nr:MULTISPECIES: LacI family DNA-binding transcriptional regulator [unclassified Bacillus (in: firmicutes)]SFB23382.1 transcriptional regulator, LacI family [Bacillus sp. UNCCL13]SFQ87735.1 transcriptional regulator, LacI family [Bacillus sp. cl95]
MSTIKDIAKVAGVSVTTVSRALNGYSDVNEKTRQKIVRVAKELNYSPNTIARSLVMNKSKTIGLLVSGLNKASVKDNITFEVLSGINVFTGGSDYDLVLFSTTSTKQREKTYSQLCKDRMVDGVIVQGIRTDDPYLKEVIESNIPCVLIDIPFESDMIGYVTTDNLLGAKKAVNHLIDLGHTKIAMMNGHEYAFVSQRRLEGYRQALKENGIDVKSEWIANGEFSEEIAETQAEELFRTHPEISAIFCASDLMALGVMNAAKKLGLNIPDQLSIVGYDDIMLASYVSPKLTTIAQNKFEMGYQAAKLLVNMLEGKEEGHLVNLDTELKVRETTKLLK